MAALRRLFGGTERNKALVEARDQAERLEQELEAERKRNAELTLKLGEPAATEATWQGWLNALFIVHEPTFEQAKTWLRIDDAGVTSDGRIFVRRGDDAAHGTYLPSVAMTEQLRDLAAAASAHEAVRPWMADDAPEHNPPRPAGWSARDKHLVECLAARYWCGLDEVRLMDGELVVRLGAVEERAPFNPAREIREQIRDLDSRLTLRIVPNHPTTNATRAVSEPTAALLNELLDDTFGTAITLLGLKELFLAKTGELVLRDNDGDEQRAVFDPGRDVSTQIGELNAELVWRKAGRDAVSPEAPAAEVLS